MTSTALDLTGFTGWFTFAELAGAEVPKEAGVYVVVSPTGIRPKFCPDAPYRGDPPVPLTVLDDAWVDGERLVYIGKANLGADECGLHRRLRQFRRYGEGHSARHAGGRRIWHMPDHANLLVAWRVTDVNAKPRDTEREMIAAFKSHHGVRPFANDAD